MRIVIESEWPELPLSIPASQGSGSAGSDHGTNCAEEYCTITGTKCPPFRARSSQRPRIDRLSPGRSLMHAPASKKTKRSAEPLFVLCPITKSSIVTDIGTDVRSLAKTWNSKIQVPCPHCKQIHKYRVSEAFAEAALSDERIRGGFSASWA
jgi:hypothetical protein